MSLDEKTKLHNRVTGLKWPKPEFDFAGPFNGQGGSPQQWLCVVRINGGEWGRAYAPSRQAASEAASTVAYNALTRAGY
ncbi:hypothetical protein K523DRAFT_239945 [Schizophyllum commune Tattone D]|nr:hypothetical protein K525DRAFT_212609 [Schizophyllum commune Loenen D]KAI5830372.1 hypothetical protein K523DRAFT_239945 [Schizophyllum commune Tattone D]